MTSPVNYTLTDNIGVITIDSPPVNALSQAVRQGIMEALDVADSDASEAVVIICDGRTFIAGADISEFGKPLKDPWLPEVVNRIEATDKPVIAAIHGTALGGGFEVALSAHYRCAVAGAKVGLPEVKLGLLPGAGGTQRTPRLAGIEAALQLMTSGVPIAAARAMEVGLIDRIVAGDLREGATAWAKELVADGVKPRRTSDQDIPAYDAAIFDGYRATLAKRARGQIAPQCIVDCVEGAATLSFAAGLALERSKFAELVEAAALDNRKAFVRIDHPSKAFHFSPAVLPGLCLTAHPRPDSVP